MTFTSLFPSPWMSKFNDEAVGGGGGDGMVSPLKNEILPITGLVLKAVLSYSLLLPFYGIFIAFNPKNLFFFERFFSYVVVDM